MLKAAIISRYRCAGNYRETVLVREALGTGQIIWEGDVEVFDLMGHEKAEVCYGWLHFEPQGTKVVTALGSGVINSPQKAVQAAIFVDSQSPSPSRFGLSKTYGDLPYLEQSQKSEPDDVLSETYREYVVQNIFIIYQQIIVLRSNITDLSSHQKLVEMKRGLDLMLQRLGRLDGKAEQIWHDLQTRFPDAQQ